MSTPTTFSSAEQIELSVPHSVNESQLGSQRSLHGPEVPERGSGTEAPVVDRSSDLRAIITCIACFVVVFTACGTNFAWGVYQELYEQYAKQPDTPFTGASSAAIDLIGTLSVAFMTILAPFASGWTRQFSPRIIIAVGGIVYGVSSVLASYSNQLWQFILFQGLLMGIGIGLSYVPAVTIAPTWFGPRRGLAMGIILSGTGVGGLVWAPAISALVDRVGFRNGLRISGALAAIVIILAGMVLKWDPVSKARLVSEQARQAQPWYYSLWKFPLVNWRIAKTRAFAIHLLGTSFQSAAYYAPIFFFATYAKTLGYSAAQGANFISVNNACNALSKPFIGIIADRYGSINTIFVVTTLSSIVTLAFWLPSNLSQSGEVSRGLFITYSVAYGVFASPYTSLFPSSIVELFGPANFASVNGFLYMARGMATLIGTPLAGLLIPSSMKLLPQNYWHLTLLVSALMAAASLSLLGLIFDEKKKRRLTSE